MFGRLRAADLFVGIHQDIALRVYTNGPPELGRIRCTVEAAVAHLNSLDCIKSLSLFNHVTEHLKLFDG